MDAARKEDDAAKKEEDEWVAAVVPIVEEIYRQELAKEVPIKIYSAGGIDCCSEDCKFHQSCAVHASAGDFRMEDGFTPELSILSRVRAKCVTFDRPADPDWKHCNVPEEDSGLGHGALIYSKDGELRLAQEPTLEETTLGEVATLNPADSIPLLKKANILTEDGKLSPKYDPSHPDFPGFGRLIVPDLQVE